MLYFCEATNCANRAILLETMVCANVRKAFLLCSYCANKGFTNVKSEKDTKFFHISTQSIRQISIGTMIICEEWDI